MTHLERELQEITDGLKTLLEGKNKRLAIVAALSVATTTAFMLRVPKSEVQAIFDRMWQSRLNH